jgi:hypothetical protein
MASYGRQIGSRNHAQELVSKFGPPLFNHFHHEILSNTNMNEMTGKSDKIDPIYAAMLVF